MIKKALEILKMHFQDATSIAQIQPNECHAQWHGFGFIEIVEKNGTLWANCSLPNGATKKFICLCDELDVPQKNRTYYRLNKMLYEIIK